MAVSAFKSTSKRGNLPTTTSSSSRTNNTLDREITEKSPKKAPPRRSRSVSAVSRSQTHLDVVSEFLNKRDNPLFSSSSSGSPPPENVAKIDEIRTGCSGAGESRRGRSVSRNADGGTKSLGGNRKVIGRSLSRVETERRGRSVSVRPVSRNHSESEVEQECGLSSNLRNSYNSNKVTSSGRNVNMVRNSSELLDGMRSPRTWSSQHPSLEPSDTSSSASCMHIPNWEHGGVMTSSWEAEEKTIRAVCEQMKGGRVEDDIATSGIYETVRSEVRRAISDIQNDLETAIRRNNTTANTNGVDVPVDTVNPGAVELVLDIRREYSKELEQSHERARKLRADLAVEEHRGQELSRILKDLLPEPKTSNLQRSRPARKSSIERRKMSKSLAEEAMTYFDECVSISTFDSSDFSSQEDPPINLIGALVGNRASLPQGRSAASTIDSPSSCLKIKEISIQGQPMHILQGSGLTASSNERNLDQASPDGNNTEQGRTFQFSFAGKPTGTFGLQRDIRNYVKKIEKGIGKDVINSETMRLNRCDIDEYNLQVPAQSFLLDRVILKNRIESGSLLLCGSFPISISPFASVL